MSSLHSWACLSRYDFIVAYGVPAKQFHAVIAPMAPQMRGAVLAGLAHEPRRTRAWLWAKTVIATMSYWLARNTLRFRS